MKTLLKIIKWIGIVIGAFFIIMLLYVGLFPDAEYKYEVESSIKILQETVDTNEYDRTVVYLDSISKLVSDTTLLKQINDLDVEDMRYSAVFRHNQAVLHKKLEMISDHFVSEGGTHKALRAYIKSRMNDPKSFDCLGSRVYFDDVPGTYIVTMKYSGKNGFGGVVTQLATARCNIETGDILEIISID